jgi:lysophospholipase L1-like esterase
VTRFAIGLVAAAVAVAQTPAPRTDRNSLLAHEQLLEKKKAGRIDIYFEGDSIVRRWGATDYPELLANWRQNFFGWNAADFGWGADKVENILWRLENGELDGIAPKVIVLLAGTNNVGAGATAAEISGGIQKMVEVMRTKTPDATIILTAIFPRHDNPAFLPTIDAANESLARLADGKRVRFLDINRQLEGSDMLNPDKLHPSVKAYQVWADALKPIFRELLGAPAEEDHAPPPTGDPSKR